jgi:hypothetical protein
VETLKKGIKSDSPSRARINKNFLIRWKTLDQKNMRLIGAGRYMNLVGEELAQRHFSKALSSNKQKIIIRIYGKMLVHFVAK